jgi:hypothetical protein
MLGMALQVNSDKATLRRNLQPSGANDLQCSFDERAADSLSLKLFGNFRVRQRKHAFARLRVINECRFDNVVVPYVDKSKNTVRNFNPDFIFWLKRGNDYSIVLIDPKGLQNTGGFAYKLDGYTELFMQHGKPKEFKYKDYTVRVFAFLFTKDRNMVGEGIYPQFWIDKMEDALSKVLMK